MLNVNKAHDSLDDPNSERKMRNDNGQFDNGGRPTGQEDFFTPQQEHAALFSPHALYSSYSKDSKAQFGSIDKSKTVSISRILCRAFGSAQNSRDLGAQAGFMNSNEIAAYVRPDDIAPKELRSEVEPARINQEERGDDSLSPSLAQPVAIDSSGQA